jgi:hypothetical protein
MLRRDHWARTIRGLDPETHHHEIYRILASLEFPWDMTQALSFALYRTYAVPSIGGLLGRTGEFTQRTQKRYDDTALLLAAVMEHGLDSTDGRAAVRRVNQMHGAYDISNDDMRYVLATLVVIPLRWLDDYGWRALTENERIAVANHCRDLGRHMGIKDIPATHQEFTTLLDDYEREHFGFDQGGRDVSDATLALMATFWPGHLLPEVVMRRFALALMDDPLLTAFRYPLPARWERRLASGALRARAHVVRWLPTRTTPLTADQLPNIRGYRQGYAISELGTFPRDR